MKKIIREIKEGGFIQVTVCDERWYIKQTGEGNVFKPSVTWQAGSYPKGIGFYRWLAEKGWDEAEAIKQDAGDKGSKVHSAIVDLIDGKEVVGFESEGKPASLYKNPTTEKEESLTLEEYECVMSFSDWWNQVKPKTITREIIVDQENHRDDCEMKKLGSPYCSCLYMGTVDWVGIIDNEIWLLDWKTSQSIWPSFELQVSSYRHAIKGVIIVEKQGAKKIKVGKPVQHMGILQVGYKRNKAGWKFTEVADKFDLFGAAQKIWFNEHGGEKPSVKDYPESLCLVEKTVEKSEKQTT